MSTNLVTFAEIEPARDVYARLCSCKHNGFPVVSSEGKISGTILRSHLVKALKLGAFCSAEGTPIEGKQHLTYDDLAVTLESETDDVNELVDTNFDGVYLDLRPVMNPWPYVVYEGASLSRVYRLYRGIGIRHLPVIDIDNKVVGILCRKELGTDWKGDSLV